MPFIGIKEAVAENSQLGEEELSIVLIAHRTDTEGVERSRRLFTTLNKNAIRVSKGETIALDEDDAMAITARKLVTKNPMFVDERILNNATDNVPPSNQTCLTTIGNLYDLLGILFTKVYIISKKKRLSDIKKELTTIRQSDEILIVDSENKFTFSEIYVSVYDYDLFHRFTQTRA